MKEERASFRMKMATLAAIGLVFFVYRCAGDPDKNCEALCKRHGQVLSKRSNYGPVQICNCVDVKGRRR